MPIITDFPASGLDVIKAGHAPGSQLQGVGRQTAWHKRQHSQNKSRARVKENFCVRGRNANRGEWGQGRNECRRREGHEGRSRARESHLNQKERHKRVNIKSEEVKADKEK